MTFIQCNTLLEVKKKIEKKNKKKNSISDKHNAEYST